jgi:hypothetical protein
LHSLPLCHRFDHQASFSVTLRPGALLVSRIRPEDGIVDVVLESVRCSLRHVVIEEPRNHLRLVNRVLLLGHEVYKYGLLIGLSCKVGGDLLKADIGFERRALIDVHGRQSLGNPVPGFLFAVA